MSIRVQIPVIFRGYTKNLEEVEVAGITVGDCMYDLIRQFPEIKTVLLNMDGELTSLVPVYKNEDYYHLLNELSPVTGGDTLIISSPGG